MIFWFYGPNGYGARQQIGKMAEQYIKKTGSDFGLERINGAQVGLSELQSALQAAPFLATSRLVIIEDLGANKQIAPKISELLDLVPESTVAIIYDSKIDKRGVYYKALSASGAVRPIEFAQLPESKLVPWIAAEAKRGGATIGRPAAVRLLQLAGDDQWRLAGEVAKLAAYSPEITIDTVNELVAPNMNDSIFDLVEAMTSGQTNRALTLYHRLLEDQMNEYYILKMVIWQLRNLVLAKAGSELTSAELAKRTSLSPFVAGKMLARQRAFDAGRLQQVFIAAVDTDYGIKSGRAKAEVLVEQLIVHVARQAATRI